MLFNKCWICDISTDLIHINNNQTDDNQVIFIDTEQNVIDASYINDETLEVSAV